MVIDDIKDTINNQKIETMKKLKAAEMLLERYKFNEPTISEEVKIKILIDSVAVLIGEYAIERKYAAMLLVKRLLPADDVENLLNDKRIYPFNRNDSRVKTWTKAVISIGYCEKCGTTENLEAHHIIKWADYPKGRIDLENGECLCVKCHAKEHKSDGLENFILSKAKKVKSC